MGPQIPPASIVTKVWVIGVYNNAAERSSARVVCPILGKTRSWQKTVKREKIRYARARGPGISICTVHAYLKGLSPHLIICI